MIDFSITEDQRAIVDMVNGFCAKEIIPKAQEHDDRCAYPEEILRKAYELGLVNLVIPREFGGSGMGPVDVTLISEQLGYACPGIAAALLINNFATAPIERFGTPAQKEKWLNLICREKLLASFAMTEPQAGSDLSGIKTRYVEKDRGYLISGQKAWISNANRADLFVVFAYPENNQRLSDLSAFIVPSKLQGVLRGKPEVKVGLRAADTAGVTFENVLLPRENLLGGAGAGFRIAMWGLAHERVGTAAIATGLQQRCVDECLRYSRERRVGGKPLAENPVIRQHVAEMQLATEASRLASLRAAWKWSRNEDFSYEASVAKAFASSSAETVALKAIHLFGGNGVSLEYPVAKLLNDAKILSIIGGTTEIQRYLIAEALYAGSRPRDQM